MPELPEVETCRQGITPYLKGQTIDYLTIRQAKLRWPVADKLHQIKNEPILDIQRRAKYLLLELTSGWIVVHLGMSGSLRILLINEPTDKHDHIDLILTNGTILRYTDPRRFGAWLWCHSLDELPQLQGLGPEPLSDSFDSNYFFAICRNKQSAIKPFIMNNRVVVGVGNIYACEALYTAHILPDRKANSLSLKESSDLVNAIKDVLSSAIQAGGTTLKDFIQFDGKPGYFAQKLQVYGRSGELCQLCHSSIQMKRISQRSSFFCPLCQK